MAVNAAHPFGRIRTFCETLAVRASERAHSSQNTRAGSARPAAQPPATRHDATVAGADGNEGKVCVVVRARAVVAGPGAFSRCVVL
jgi:hypothetical protein